MVFSVGFVLLVSLVASAGLAAVTKFFSGLIPGLCSLAFLCLLGPVYRLRIRVVTKQVQVRPLSAWQKENELRVTYTTRSSKEFRDYSSVSIPAARSSSRKSLQE